METKNFKIAFATDDGATISAHFGRANFYEVVDVQNGKVSGREKREKSSHHHQNNHHVHTNGVDHQSHEERHLQMTQSIQDCDYVVARGMGYGMYNHLNSLGKTAIITAISDIDSAAIEIIDGSIQNHIEKLH
ncbi:MAG: NifB/NifX family molybdenum-iron cluster-binding protein [Bacteroidota bacterium]